MKKRRTVPRFHVEAVVPSGAALDDSNLVDHVAAMIAGDIEAHDVTIQYKIPPSVIQHQSTIPKGAILKIGKWLQG